MLEVLVHIGREQAPTDYVFVEAVIPDDAIETLDPSLLPTQWQAEPPPAELVAIGDDWVRSRRSLALCVPSALIPQEWNVMVNPAHPRFAEITIPGAPQPTILNPRLFG